MRSEPASTHSRLALAVLVAATTVAVTADARVSRTGTQVAFHALGPAGMRINGTTSSG